MTRETHGAACGSHEGRFILVPKLCCEWRGMVTWSNNDHAGIEFEVLFRDQNHAGGVGHPSMQQCVGRWQGQE